MNSKTTHTVIYRHSVPVDGMWYSFKLHPGSRILHVASRDRGVVDFWVESVPGQPVKLREFRAFATGESLPDYYFIRGTAIDGPYVWHLVERDAL